MAKAGYYGGNPESVLNAPIDIIMQAYNYERYLKEYEETFFELNKEN